MIINIIRGAGKLLRHRRAAALSMALVFALAAIGSVAAYDRYLALEGDRAIPVSALESHGRTLLAYTGDSLENMVDPGGDRFFEVSVLCDGETILLQAAWGDSVEDIIKRSGVVLSEEDQLSHMPHRPVEPNDEIVVERWVRDVYTTHEDVPFGTVTVSSSLLKPGRSRVVSEGTPGILARTYERLLVNGKVAEQTLQSEAQISEPVAQKILVGEAGKPVSPLVFAWTFDETGAPVGYADVLTKSRAAGYSARAGALTASGRAAVVGHVAVNPNVIPYGSKLYITSADGSFVYGYAVAADTGTALKQGIIDVDLFYATYLESALNEIRTVDIYILEYPEA